MNVVLETAVASSKEWGMGHFDESLSGICRDTGEVKRHSPRIQHTLTAYGGWQRTGIPPQYDQLRGAVALQPIRIVQSIQLR